MRLLRVTAVQGEARTSPLCTAELTIDASGLWFTDSASIRALLLAARTLQVRGGRLVLLHPQPPVARALALLGADQMLTIRGNPPGEPEATKPTPA